VEDRVDARDRPVLVPHAVAAVSRNDVWAVGARGDRLTLIEHWNGVSWRIIPSPSPAPSDGYPVKNDSLWGVAAVSRNDVWAVGELGLSSGFATLIEHWNGRQWTVVPSPNPAPPASGFDELFAVTAGAGHAPLAVGLRYTLTTDPRPLVEEWNGQRWVAQPVLPHTTAELGAVTAVSRTQVWAVGTNLAGQPLILRARNGVWSHTTVAGVASGDLAGIAGSSPNDVWAVGRIPGYRLVVHWDGTRWREVTTPKLGSGGSALVGVTALRTGQVWTVGQSYPPTPLAQPNTVVEECAG
jgi:hypothetical protein